MKHNDTARLRANHALALIEAYAKNEKDQVRSAYLSYVKSLPATIRSNGLGQALAMLLARAGQDTEAGQGGRAPAAYGHLYRHVEDWFHSDDCPHRARVDALVGSAGAGANRLLKAVLAASQRDYLLIQAETSLYVEWLKKFANAFLRDGAGDDRRQAERAGAGI
jgi:CRISPR-associated protein Cmr5